MPQLDHFSFISQVFWFLVIFFSFYMLILRFVLPDIARVLKLRQYTVNELIEEQKGFEDEAIKAINNYKSIVGNWSTFTYNHIFGINEAIKKIQLQQNSYAVLSEDIQEFNPLFVKTLVDLYIKKAVVKIL